MALNMLRLDAKLGGGSPLIFVRGHFQEISIAALPLGMKPRHVEKFETVGWRTSEKVSWQKKQKKHAQNITSHSQNGRS